MSVAHFRVATLDMAQSRFGKLDLAHIFGPADRSIRTSLVQAFRRGRDHPVPYL